MTKTFSAYDSQALPEPVVAYLDAHDENRHSDAAALFAPDATVLDDGSIYQGAERIGAWIEKSSTEYSYTSSRIGQHIADAVQAHVQVRLDGNFPGGTVTLRYQFELHAGRISRLAIEV